MLCRNWPAQPRRRSPAQTVKGFRVADTLNKWSFALSRPLPFLPGFSRPVEYNNLLYFGFCYLFLGLSVSFAAEAGVHHFIIYITHLLSIISISTKLYIK